MHFVCEGLRGPATMSYQSVERYEVSNRSEKQDKVISSNLLIRFCLKVVLQNARKGRQMADVLLTADRTLIVIIIITNS